MTELIKQIIPKDFRQKIRKQRTLTTKAIYRTFARQLQSISSDEYTGLTYLFEEHELNPTQVIRGYMLGIFPSSFYGNGRTTWHDPEPRGFLPIQDFHIPRNLRRILRQNRFEVHVNKDFKGVMEGCAEDRERTHIDDEYIEVYLQLHKMGIAHSVSAWQDGELVGGTYGVALGAYFASESAFHRVRDASKVATVRLTEILIEGGFMHHDTWWFSRDIEQFGGGSLSRADFHQKHLQAIVAQASFNPDVPYTLSTGTIKTERKSTD